MYIVVKSHLGRAALIEARKMDVVPIGCSVNLKVFSLYRTEAASSCRSLQVRSIGKQSDGFPISILWSMRALSDLGVYPPSL